MSPMTNLAVNFEAAATLSPSKAAMRRNKSPKKNRAAMRKSKSHIQRAKYDENAQNFRSSSPLQFDLSPAASPNKKMGGSGPMMMMMGPSSTANMRTRPVISPAPIPSSGSRESSGDLSWLSRSSSEVSSTESSLIDGELAAITARPLPSKAVPPPPQQQRRYMSMSANNLFGRKSPDDEGMEEDEAPKRPSPVKKNLFNGGGGSLEQPSAEDQDEQPAFRWERSASMMDLSFVPPVPRGVSPRGVSPPNVASISSAAPVAMRSSSVMLPLQGLHQPRPSLMMRRRGSVMQLDRASSYEKKRVREGMPMPDLRKSSADAVPNTARAVPGGMGAGGGGVLPLIQNLKHDGLDTISCETVRDVLLGRYANQFEHIFILDCRFDYEFEGGHIDGAIHANDPQVLVDLFFKKDPIPNAAFIFHCEFSSKRGPSQQKLFRELDRKANQANYPHLHYPHLFLMDGGYCKFFELFGAGSFCSPPCYITMDDERFRDRLKDNLVMKHSSFKKKRRPSLVSAELLAMSRE